MPKLEIILYETPDGTCPVAAFLLGLEPKLRAKTMRTIELLQNNGHELREPYSKALDNGLFELRVKVASNIARVLYFFYYGGTAVLTNGFVKKSDKIPDSQKDLARQYRADYLAKEGTP